MQTRLCCTLMPHRIRVNQSMVGTLNASAQPRYEMSGLLTHAAPRSMVHCLCSQAQPQTYKSKGGEVCVCVCGEGVMKSSRQESRTHLCGQGTVPKSCSLTVNSGRRGCPAARDDKANNACAQREFSCHTNAVSLQLSCTVYPVNVCAFRVILANFIVTQPKQVLRFIFILFTHKYKDAGVSKKQGFPF